MRKPASARKAEITEATLRLADKLGPDRLTAAAIARHVGLTQPAIFRHFPTKQALWAAVGSAISEKMTAMWAKVSREDEPMVRLRGLVAGQLRLIQSMPAIPAVLFSRELHVENEALRATVLGLMNRLHRAIAKLIAEARRAGALRNDLDPDDAAFLVIGLIQGLAVRWSLGGRNFALVGEGRRLLELQLRGFAHPIAQSDRRRSE